MLEHAISLDSSSVYNRVIADMTVVAFHILMKAGLGISQPFSEGVREPGPGHTMLFGYTLSHWVENILVAIILSLLFKPWLLPFLPKGLRGVYMAKNKCSRSKKREVEKQKLLQKFTTTSSALW
jgi:hypothetical protein